MKTIRLSREQRKFMAERLAYPSETGARFVQVRRTGEPVHELLAREKTIADWDGEREAAAYWHEDEARRCYTPDPLAEAIVERAYARFGHCANVLEPSAGGGAFVRALVKRAARMTAEASAAQTRARSVTVTALEVGHLPELVSDLPEGSFYRATHTSFEHYVSSNEDEWLACQLPRGYDLVIGNPPFECAESHVRLAHTAGRRVVFLLRLSFLGSKSREPFFREFPPIAVDVLTPRPKFYGGGSDNSEYAVYTWGPRNGPRTPELHWMRWQK